MKANPKAFEWVILVQNLFDKDNNSRCLYIFFLKENFPLIEIDWFKKLWNLLHFRVGVLLKVSDYHIIIKEFYSTRWKHRSLSPYWWDTEKMATYLLSDLTSVPQVIGARTECWASVSRFPASQWAISSSSSFTLETVVGSCKPCLLDAWLHLVW